MKTHTLAFALLALGLCTFGLSAGGGGQTGKGKGKRQPKWDGTIKVDAKAEPIDLAKRLKLASLGDAEKAALGAIAGTAKKVRAVQLEVINDYLVYWVEVVDADKKRSTVAIIDAANAKVLEHQQIETRQWDGSIRVQWNTTISQAEKAALAAVKGKGKAVDAELKVVNGCLAFEIAVVVPGVDTEYLAIVDAGNGKALVVEVARRGGLSS